MAILKTEFRGDRGGLFLLALRLGFLTFLTVGFYRFWAKTRLRRWYWSAVRVGGSPLEYTGTALEKLAGFFFALFLLAVLLTAVNLTGIMITIRMMAENPDALTWAPFGALLLILPLWNFARYRSRRYILSRSRWRGIRFGMERGAWGYSARATIYGILTIITGGLLLPLRTFRLEKYLTDRTWYGNARFTQHGNALRLFGPVFPLLLALWGGAGLMYLAISQNIVQVVEVSGIPFIRLADEGGLIFFASLACIPLAGIFAVYYRIASIRVLTALKELGDGVEFDLWPKTRNVLRIYIFGWWKTYLASSFVYGAFSGLVWSFLWITGIASAEQIPALMENPPVGVLIALGIGSYIVITVLANVFRQTFITYPVVKHISETLEIHQPELLGTIRQRQADGRTDAGGFAEALDAGAAF